jgi:hypothetical protein
MKQGVGLQASNDCTPLHRLCPLIVTVAHIFEGCQRPMPHVAVATIPLFAKINTLSMKEPPKFMNIQR